MFFNSGGYKPHVLYESGANMYCTSFIGHFTFEALLTSNKELLLS